MKTQKLSRTIFLDETKIIGIDDFQYYNGFSLGQEVILKYVVYKVLDCRTDDDLTFVYCKEMTNNFEKVGR